MAEAIQYKGRQRGWRMPANAVYVGRHMSRRYGRYGNPYRVGDPYFVARVDGTTWYQHTPETAVAAFRRSLPDLLDPLSDRYLIDVVREELAGRDLACWCPLDRPCHRSVLLHVANGGEL